MINRTSAALPLLNLARAGLATALVALLPVALRAMTATPGGPLPQPFPLLPDDNWWNLDISAWPVDPASGSYVSFINNGGTRHLHPDLGGNAPTPQDPYACYGMPYVVVSGVTSADLAAVQFQYASESDGVDHTSGVSIPFYPIPPEARSQPYWIEGGDPGNVDLRSSQDRHLIIVDADRNYLYELYNVFYSSTDGKWRAGSGAFFDLNTNDRRPDGWTSADAAGLAVLPGLIRHEEVYPPDSREIEHAFRVTVRATDGYVYPASHRAGSTVGALPMGARLRLKASVDIAQRTSNPDMQRIFRALKKYGVIVADNGSDLYITGTYDSRWDNGILNPAFYSLTANDFEVIKLGYNPVSAPSELSALNVSPTSLTGGQPATGTVNLTGPAPTSGTVISLSSDKPGSASVPASVTVAPGAATASFGINTVAVPTSTLVTLTAAHGTVVRQATLQLNPPVLTALTLNPSTLNGGASATGTVIVSSGAPTGGLSVSLSSSKPSVASVPTTVLIPAGRTSATFTVATTKVAASTSVSIAGSLGGVTRTATLTIRKIKH